MSLGLASARCDKYIGLIISGTYSLLVESYATSMSFHLTERTIFRMRCVISKCDTCVNFQTSVRKCIRLLSFQWSNHYCLLAGFDILPYLELDSKEDIGDEEPCANYQKELSIAHVLWSTLHWSIFPKVGFQIILLASMCMISFEKKATK